MSRKIEASLVTGQITSIYSEDGFITCDVRDYRITTTHDNVIIPSRFRYEATTPQEGDKVVIQKTDQGEWILQDVLSVSVPTLPDLEENEYVLRFEDGTRLEITKNGAGDYDVDIEASGDVDVSATNITASADKTLDADAEDIEAYATKSVTVEAGGNIRISAEGDVFIDEGGTPKSVAYQDHTHDYSGSDSDGNSYSGTTTTPNEPGTETEIE